MFTSIIKIRKGWKYCREVLAHSVRAVGPLGWLKLEVVSTVTNWANLSLKLTAGQVTEWICVCVFESLPAMCPLNSCVALVPLCGDLFACLELKKLFVSTCSIGKVYIMAVSAVMKAFLCKCLQFLCF